MTTTPSSSFTVGDKIGNRIGVQDSDFRLDGIGNSKPIDELRHPADSQITDRFCVQQRALECFDSADVRFWRSRPHLHAGPRARQIGARVCDELALLERLSMVA
jgi:hypothetical protein